MQINRSRRPLSSNEQIFTPPKIGTFILKNGLKILFSEKSELPIIRINFLVNNGSKFDPDDKKGLSNLLAMCIDEGAGELNALQLSEEFEMLGANFSVSCNNDVAVISLQVLKEYFIPALKIFRDVIIRPHLNEKDFEREKHKVLVRLNQSKAEPDFIADMSFEYFLFGNDSPYAFPTIGLDYTIQNIQNRSIKETCSQKFLPSESTLVIVGEFDRDKLITIIDKEFGQWNGKSSSISLTAETRKADKKIIVINKPDYVQTEIRVGQLSTPRNQKDFFQKQIINLILGGQFSSRLNLNLREKNGFTYGVHSNFNYYKEAGYFAVSTSVDLENTLNALKEIYSEIISIKSGITDEELRFAKSSLTKKFPSNFETYRQIAANISNKVLYDLPDDYFETYVEKITALTLDDINYIANNSFRLDEMISVLVGDAKIIVSRINENTFGELKVLEYDEVFQS